jgi:hypothetical protein
MSAEVKKLPKPKIDRTRAYIAKMDPAIEGSGGDDQTFIVACKLIEFGLSQSEAMTVFSEYNQRCQPPWSESELERKLANASRTASVNPEFSDGTAVKWKPVERVKLEPKWPPAVAEASAAIIQKTGIGLADLWELSPIRPDDSKPMTIPILEALFAGNPLVCCGKSSSVFWTRPLSDYGHDVESYQLIVPNPMSALTGRIKNARPGHEFSAHSLDNTGPRKFAVIEFDSGSSDDHASLLWHLSSFWPFVLAVHSGGKSLHGWFHVAGSDEDQILKFYRYATSIGADKATRLKSQFVRMPDGRRSTGQKQCVFYFNPAL